MTRPDHPRLTKVLYQAWLDAWQEAFSDVPDALAAALDENPDIVQEGQQGGGERDALLAIKAAAVALVAHDSVDNFNALCDAVGVGDEPAEPGQ